MELPNRAKLRNDSEEPRVVISMTDNENTEPTRASPKTETVEPNREKLRIDSELPK